MFSIRMSTRWCRRPESRSLRIWGRVRALSGSGASPAGRGRRAGVRPCYGGGMSGGILNGSFTGIIDARDPGALRYKIGQAGREDAEA